MEASAIRIILVDDEEAILDISREYLELDKDILADTATSVAVARELIGRREYDVVVSDYHMPDEDGLTFLRGVRAEGNTIPFILFTGKGREEVAIEALNSGASFYLQKGGDPNTQFAELANMIRNANSRHRSERDLRRATEALTCSERKFRRLFEAAQDGILILEYESGKVTDANPFILDITGYSLAQTLGKRLWELGFIEDKVMAQKAFEELRNKGYARYENLPLESNKGSIVHVEFVSNVYSIGKEKVIQCNIRDIEDRFLLTMKTDELASIVDSTGMAIIGNDLGGIVTSWNMGAERIYGYSESEMVGRPILLLAHQDSEKDIQENLAKVSRGERITQLVQKHTRKDGVMVQLMLAISPVSGKDGRIIGASTIAFDITAQGRIELQLKERMKELEALYKIGEIDKMDILGPDDVCQEVANMLPNSWQYPEIACARIVIGDDEFCTSNFKRSLWTQSAPIVVNKSEVGKVEVSYLEERPKSDEGAFIKEERALLDAVAERMGRIIERTRAQKPPYDGRANCLPAIIKQDICEEIATLEEDLARLDMKGPQISFQDNLERAKKDARHIFTLTQFTRDYDAIGTEAPSWNPIRSMIKIASLLTPLGGVRLVNDVPRDLEVFADPLIKKVFCILVDNSLRCGSDISTIHFSTKRIGTARCIVCENNGTGISTEMKDSLFALDRDQGLGFVLSKDILAVTGIVLKLPAF